MKETDLIKKTIIKNVFDLYKIKVVDADNNHRRPTLPYVTLKFITHQTSDGQAGNYSAEFIEAQDKKFKYDIKETLDYQPIATLSVSATAETESEARELVEHMHDYFKFVGRPKFESINTTIVTVGDIGNRTIGLADGITFDFKFGFDVAIRYLKVIERTSPNIEKWKAEGKLGDRKIETEGKI